MTIKDKGSAGNLKDNAPSSVALTPAEEAKAHHEGAKDAAKEAGKAAYKSLTDGSNPGENTGRQWHGYDEIMPWAYILELGVDEFEERVAEKKGETTIPDEKVYGLLALERNGQNRTPYVKAMMKRLGLKSDELPGGGPDYTNDVTNITKL